MSEAPFPSFTKKWHNTSYTAIDPTRPDVSLRGKSIVITGGGRGIGASIAYAYAQAGAPTIGLTGRTESTLLSLKNQIEAAFPSTKVFTAAADISDAPAIEAAFAKFNDAFGGKGIDILIQNAGLLPRARKIADLDTPELLAAWWAGFQTNVLGLAVVAKTFSKYKSANDPKFINIGTGGTAFPAMPSFSGYVASKFASAYVLQYFQAENLGLKVYNMHPGVIKTTEMGKDGFEDGVELPEDDISLPGHFAVWLASKQAEFLSGARLVYCNWDVEELVERKAEYEQKVAQDDNFGRLALIQNFD